MRTNEIRDEIDFISGERSQLVSEGMRFDTVGSSYFEADGIGQREQLGVRTEERRMVWPPAADAIWHWPASGA